MRPILPKDTKSCNNKETKSKRTGSQTNWQSPTTPFSICTPDKRKVVSTQGKAQTAEREFRFCAPESLTLLSGWSTRRASGIPCPTARCRGSPRDCRKWKQQPRNRWNPHVLGISWKLLWGGAGCFRPAGKIVREVELVLLTPWQTSRSRGKTLGQRKWLYSESQQTKGIVDYCPRTVSPHPPRPRPTPTWDLSIFYVKRTMRGGCWSNGDWHLYTSEDGLVTSLSLVSRSSCTGIWSCHSCESQT